jgi:hypothetical protein
VAASGLLNPMLAAGAMAFSRILCRYQQPAFYASPGCKRLFISQARCSDRYEKRRIPWTLAQTVIIKIQMNTCFLFQYIVNPHNSEPIRSVQ